MKERTTDVNSVLGMLGFLVVGLFAVVTVQIWREAGPDLYGHSRLAGEREAEGLPVPERAGGAVRIGERTVVP